MITNMIKKKTAFGKGSDEGFTLVEVLVTLVIIAVLAAISIPSFVGYIDKSREKAYIAEARLVSQAVQVYITEEYAKGTLNEIKVGEDLLLYQLGDKEHALTGLLRGSFTKGSMIIELSIEYETAMLKSLTYRVNDQDIKLDYGQGFESRP